MKTTALAPWFGSKRTLAPEIVKLLGKHRSYWGLCCGSLAVELAKDPCPNETVCDLHGDLTNLAWVLQKESTAVELYARLARTLPSEENFLASQRAILAAADWDDDAPNVDRAFHYFFNSWMGRSGMAGTCRGNSQISVRWTANGGSPAVRFRSAIESIPDWHHRLAYFLILRRNVFDVARSIEDEPGTSIYCDPPYLFRTRKSNDNRVGGAGRYRHEFTEDDHVALAVEIPRQFSVREQLWRKSCCRECRHADRSVGHQPVAGVHGDDSEGRCRLLCRCSLSRDAELPFNLRASHSAMDVGPLNYAVAR